MSGSRRRALRWAMATVGAVLILATVAISLYARFGGERLQGEADVAAGSSYLVANGGVARCRLAETDGPTRSVEVRPPGDRAALSGTTISTTAGGRLTCTGGDVEVTNGPMLSFYPMAEYEYLPVIAGAILIGLARFVLTDKRRTS